MQPKPRDVAYCGQRQVAGAGRADLDLHAPRSCLQHRLGVETVEPATVLNHSDGACHPSVVVFLFRSLFVRRFLFQRCFELIHRVLVCWFEKRSHFHGLFRVVVAKADDCDFGF